MSGVFGEIISLITSTTAGDIAALKEASGFIGILTAGNSLINNIVWGLPCCFLIILVGIWLTCGNGFIQFSKFGYVMKNTLGLLFKRHSTDDEGAMTPFQAMSTALAGTVGTGNIAGVAGAITIGGPGAVFWMWISALFGMCTKYSEIVLAVKFRERNKNGEWQGGPMYYIANGLGKNWKWLAVLFSVFATFASFGIGNMTQINSIVGTVDNLFLTFSSNPQAVNTNAIHIVVGLILMAVLAVVLFGGIKRIGKTTSVLVPFMAALYIIGGLVVVIVNIQNVGPTFKLIFDNAFGINPVIGGTAGYVIANSIKMGFARGCFSNEAGLGSAPIAHATADTPSPIHQAIYGIFEVFIDTIIICTLTALIILLPNIEVAYGVKAGAELTTAGLATVFGAEFSAIFMTIALGCFAFSTVLGWAVYGSRSLGYLFGEKGIKVYYVIFILMVMVGATMDLSLAWNISDTMNGLMALPNLLGVALLSPVVFKLTKEHFQSIKPAKKK